MKRQPGDYGICCACAEAGVSARIVIYLPWKMPVDLGGWGCTVCGLEDRGAFAVLCTRCGQEFDFLRDHNQIGRAAGIIRWYCIGNPAENFRGPIRGLTEPHWHNSAVHEQFGSIRPLPDLATAAAPKGVM